MLMHMVVEIEGVPLHLAHPDELNVTWVGQDETMRQLLAAWLVVDPQDLPMNPRLLGKSGTLPGVVSSNVMVSTRFHSGTLFVDDFGRKTQ